MKRIFLFLVTLFFLGSAFADEVSDDGYTWMYVRTVCAAPDNCTAVYFNFEKVKFEDCMADPKNDYVFCVQKIKDLADVSLDFQEKQFLDFANAEKVKPVFSEPSIEELNSAKSVVVKEKIAPVDSVVVLSPVVSPQFNLILLIFNLVGGLF